MTKRNITDAETSYYEAVQTIIDDCPKQLLASAPNLASNRVSVQTLISRYELYKLILDVPGDVIECGVYQGNSLLWMAHLSVILEPYAINRRFYGFDTFEGFQSIDGDQDPDDISSKNFSDTSQDLIQRAMDAIDIVRPVNKINRFNLVKGDICETIPEFINSDPAFTCALLILDTDLYQPTLVALKHVLPTMPKGAIVCLDEYNYQNFPGETAALKEACKIYDLRLKRFPYDSCMAYFEV